MNEENLIFVISQPRAGSTYLQNLLSNDNETNTCSESWVLLNFANYMKPKIVNGLYDNEIAVAAFKDYLGKHSVENLNLEMRRIIKNVYEPLFENHKYVIDKTPRYWELIEEIPVWFPKSKIIVLKRNPMDVVKSMANTWNLQTVRDLAYFKRDLLKAPKKLNKFCLNNAHNPNVRSIQYEQLVESTSEVIQELYQWLGITYNNSVLDTTENVKYKGNFGDPYQNKFGNEKKTVSRTSDTVPGWLKRFQQGYAFYLGEDFFNTYGNYPYEKMNPRKTRAFSYLIHRINSSKEKMKLSDEINYITKEVYYRIFS